MKIKSDFVTNSSSTCFIVIIPDEYRISDETFANAQKELEHDYCFPDDIEEETDNIPEMSHDEIRDVLHEFIETLKCGNEITKHYEISGIKYDLLVEILSFDNCIIDSMHQASSYDNCLKGLETSKIMNIILNNLNLEKLIKIKGNKNEKK